MSKSNRHPAAASSDSDLVRLTREFESLKKQLEENDEKIAEHHENIIASREEHELNLKFNHDKVRHLQRQRRVLEASFTNVKELLEPLVMNRNLGAGCERLALP